MMGGNQAYDSFMQSPLYLGVVEAIPFVRSSLGSLSYEEELTVCFVKEPNSGEESSLSFHLSRRLINTNAAFTIINGLTISFVSNAIDNIILRNSHHLLPKGTLLAQSHRSDIEELLNWLKLRLSATVNLCTVTFINFMEHCVVRNACKRQTTAVDRKAISTYFQTQRRLRNVSSINVIASITFKLFCGSNRAVLLGTLLH